MEGKPEARETKTDRQGTGLLKTQVNSVADLLSPYKLAIYSGY